MRNTRISVINSKIEHRPMNDSAILDLVIDRIDTIALDAPDIILLSEVFGNHPSSHPESLLKDVAQDLNGSITTALSIKAKQYATYIAFGLLRKDNSGKIYNSIVLLDRAGIPVWIYDKITPVPNEIQVWNETPGKFPEVYKCDFGIIGGAICFDINFNEIAEIYSRQNLELLLFSSAFPAGRLLDGWAVKYGFNIAMSTRYDYNRILDCTGATVARTSDILPYMTAEINLNRRVVHMDYNLDKINLIKTRFKKDVLIEDLRDEALMVISSMKKGLEVEDIIHEFGIETLPDYFDRSRRIRAEAHGLMMPKLYS
jgi:carbon-nitrogen hydrolase